MNQPDVSEINPVYVPKNSTRSYLVNIVFINGYGRYQETPGYWDAVEKLWRRASGVLLDKEVVKTKKLPETIRHY